MARSQGPPPPLAVKKARCCGRGGGGGFVAGSGKGGHRSSLSAYPFGGFVAARRCPCRQRRPGSQRRRASGPHFPHRLHDSRLGGPRRRSCPSSCSIERHFPSQCRSSSKPWWALRKDTHSKPKDAPKAAAEGTQLAPPEGPIDAASLASGAKAAETLLPSLIIWPPSQRMREAVMRRIVQTVAAPSVLSRRYGTVPEPEAERAAAAVQAEAFAVVSEFAPARPRPPSSRG